MLSPVAIPLQPGCGFSRRRLTALLLRFLRRFLAILGEGVSSQVILAADTFRSAAPHVAIKILKRQYSYAGQKVRLCMLSPPPRRRLLESRYRHAGPLSGQRCQV